MRPEGNRGDSRVALRAKLDSIDGEDSYESARKKSPKPVILRRAGRSAMMATRLGNPEQEQIDDLATPEDILKRKMYQFRRYVELSMSGNTPPEWKKYGRRHWEDIEPLVTKIMRDINLQKRNIPPLINGFYILLTLSSCI